MSQKTQMYKNYKYNESIITSSIFNKRIADFCLLSCCIFALLPFTWYRSHASRVHTPNKRGKIIPFWELMAIQKTKFLRSEKDDKTRCLQIGNE